jgi:hypothetical protein
VQSSASELNQRGKNSSKIELVTRVAANTLDGRDCVELQEIVIESSYAAADRQSVPLNAGIAYAVATKSSTVLQEMLSSGTVLPQIQHDMSPNPQPLHQLEHNSSIVTDQSKALPIDVKSAVGSPQTVVVASMNSRGKSGSAQRVIARQGSNADPSNFVFDRTSVPSVSSRATAVDGSRTLNSTQASPQIHLLLPSVAQPSHLPGQKPHIHGNSKRSDSS